MKPKRLIAVRFRKDRQKWEVDRWNPPGSDPLRSRTLFDTEEAALAYAAELAPRLGVGAAPVRGQHMTLEQTFARFFEAKARKRTLAEDRRMAEHLMAHFGRVTALRALTSSRIAAYREERLKAGSVTRKDAHGRPAPLSAASVNRPLALLRSVLRMAHREWEVLPRMPVITLEHEPQGRMRWLELAEEARLLEACVKSPNRDLRDIVTVALETGMRQGEIMELTWERVDLSRGVLRLELTKSGRRREVPMREAVYRLLAARPGPRQGRIWSGAFPRAAWDRAVADAGIEELTFHDIRHHFASWFVMRGGKLQALQEILGHRSLAMTQRYAHLAPDHLRSEMLATERRVFLEPNSGTERPPNDESILEVLDSADERRGSSVVEQLIRNQ
jgi:integrase